MRALTFLLLVLVPSVTPTRNQVPELTVEVDSTIARVGDIVTLQVSVDHRPGEWVLWPDSLDLAPFEIARIQTRPPVGQGDLARSVATYSLMAFELGDLEIPSFEVEVVNETGDRATLSTTAFGIRVVSVGLDEGGDIREIKGPLQIPLSLARVLLFAMAVLTAAALVRGIYRKMRRPKGVRPVTENTLPTRPPHEIALEALANLEGSPLLERGEVKEFHIQVSDILRTYVEGRFRVPALEMTTEDILDGLGRVGTESIIVEGFREFLYPCDMVKFAKQRPSVEESLSVLRGGRHLVETTAPVEAAAEGVSA